MSASCSVWDLPSSVSKPSTTGESPSSSPVSHIPLFRRALMPAKGTKKERFWTWGVVKEETFQSGPRAELQKSFLQASTTNIIQLYVLSHPFSTDIASISVDQARARWEGMKGSRFDASFAAIDCYNEPIRKAFPAHKLAVPFDVVSMQFCMHYAFETAQKVRCMLDNVTTCLRPGGVFIGTIPNSEALL